MQSKSLLHMALSMFIFGTIGIFRRFIPLSSVMLAALRGVIGAAFLLIYVRMKGMRLSIPAIRRNLVLLVVSGGLIGLNWLLLFEAYKYTSVAVATLCYYMAPVFVMIASPFVLGEKMNRKKALCIVLALCGMALVSGVLKPGANASLRGVLLGLGAAALYATVIMLNKKLHDIPSYDQTIVQLAMAAVVLVPFLAIGSEGAVALTPLVVSMLLVVGIVHTGFAYALYFGALSGIPAQTAALLSYIDPVVAVLLSSLLLHEPMGAMEIAGTLLVLGSTIASETWGAKE